MITKPVRKIGMSHRSITGKHVSRKTESIHRFESALERDYLIRLEFDDEVSSYVTQPITIHYSHEDNYLRYTPDMLVYFNEELNRKPLLCEVKYEAELIEKQTEYEVKFDAARKYAKENGYQFQTVTEKQIRTVYLENLKLLCRYHDKEIEPKYARYIQSLLKRESFIEIEAVAGTESERPYLLNAIWQMLAAKSLGCEMNSKITMNTLIWNL